MPSLSTNTEGLLTAFTTFLVSSGLVANGWNAAIAAGTNPLKLSTNASAIIPDWALYKCPECQGHSKNMGCTAYDANNQCGRWWYSENFRSAFTLIGQAGQDPGNTIAQILTNKWSTGPLLFENSSICDAFASLAANDPKLTLESSSNIGDATGQLTANVRVFDASKPDLAFLWKNLADSTVRGISLKGASTDDGETLTTGFAKPDTTLKHPGNTLQVYTGGGIEFSCTSQLSTSLLGDGWVF